MEIYAVERHRESEAQGVLADHVLLDQFVNEGSQDAFARLMKRYGPYVFGVCKRVTFHAQDAEDVFQACFLELARRASSLRQRGSVAAWLQVVAVRLGRRARARAARRQQVEAATPVNHASVNADDITWREVRRLLEEEVAGLSEDLRGPLVLCLFQEQTQEEAAARLNVNPRTLKDRLRRGRELLRRRLTRRGITLAVIGTLLATGSVQAAVPAHLVQVTLQATAAVTQKASLAGIVSPTVINLTGSSAFATGVWVAAGLVGLALCGSAAYVAWDRLVPPPHRVASQTGHGPVTVKRSFRGKQFDDKFFGLAGPRPEAVIRHQDEGLRITLPAMNGPAQAVGVKLRHPVRGDFDFETTLEVLRMARPPWRNSAGATVYFFLPSPERDGLWVGKMKDPGLGLVFATGQRVDRDGERITKGTTATPAQRETGLTRLRAVRVGSRFSFFAADGGAGVYQHLHTLDVSAADVTVLRIAADPVWEPNVAVEIRVLDLSITAEEIVGYVPP
jgi:RNA polymerase sigma factor (sigma-70 family)